MLTAAQLLKTLEEQGVRNVEIARALGLTQTRASELRKGARRLLYDEGVALVEAFGAELAVEPSPESLLLLSRYAAAVHAASKVEHQAVEKLASNFSAAFKFLRTSPRRFSSEALEGFLEGLATARGLTI